MPPGAKGYVKQTGADKWEKETSQERQALPVTGDVLCIDDVKEALKKDD